MVTLEQIKQNKDFAAMIKAACDYLEQKGFTEHGMRHVNYVSESAYNILQALGYSKRDCELAGMAGWLHDIGNFINRSSHALTGAAIVFPMLIELGMAIEEAIVISSALGNHDESIGVPTNAITSALIIADKSDAHKTRVRDQEDSKRAEADDIHDRVNLAIKKNMLVMDVKQKVIKAKFIMDNTKASVMDFLQIYIDRMILCERAAKNLGCTFQLIINDFIVNRQLSNGTVSEKDIKLERSETKLCDN
ncbi:MAG: HD domain-containing protein [Firmicutes bacterium]|nr:HD domain-containing protein [Bacillota bacterium]